MYDNHHYNLFLSLKELKNDKLFLNILLYLYFKWIKLYLTLLFSIDSICATILVSSTNN